MIMKEGRQGGGQGGKRRGGQGGGLGGGQWGRLGGGQGAGRNAAVCNAQSLMQSIPPKNFMERRNKQK